MKLDKVKGILIALGLSFTGFCIAHIILSLISWRWSGNWIYLLSIWS